MKLLEVLRDKRLMFVGDSIQRGMFESMVCLVQSVLPDGEKSLERIPPRKIFTAKVLSNLPLYPLVIIPTHPVEMSTF